MFVEPIHILQPYYRNGLFSKEFLQVRQKNLPHCNDPKIHCRIIGLRFVFSFPVKYTKEALHTQKKQILSQFTNYHIYTPPLISVCGYQKVI